MAEVVTVEMKQPMIATKCRRLNTGQMRGKCTICSIKKMVTFIKHETGGTLSLSSQSQLQHDYSMIGHHKTGSTGPTD